MKLGTKSLLFGCHQFFLHPLFVLIGWVKLYGWESLSLKMLIAIFIHDWGYWGCKSMDGPDGSKHPIYGANLILKITNSSILYHEILLHSRHMSALHGWNPSRLCWADKLGLVLIPPSLWAILAYASGEGWEYMSNPYGNNYASTEERTLMGLVRFNQKFRVSIRKEIP